jgi:hypothetical protein
MIIRLMSKEFSRNLEEATTGQIWGKSRYNKL